MVKYQVNFLWTACCFLFIFALTSCSEDNLSEANETFEASLFEDLSVAAIQESAAAGRRGCFEFVFPISIAFADESTVEVASYEELRETIQEWKENNTNDEEKPNLVFPVELLDENGDILTVNSREELREIRRACRGFSAHGPKGCGAGKEICFELVFPVSLAFPDGSQEIFEDRSSLKQAVREYIQENGEDNKPSLAFPVEVEMEDGTITTVNSTEELSALKESCQEDS